MPYDLKELVMARAHPELSQIMQTGGGLDIVARHHPHAELVQLAVHAGRSGATLILRETGNMSTQELMEIASNGAGKVILVLD
jgi:hypothetical protein